MDVVAKARQTAQMGIDEQSRRERTDHAATYPKAQLDIRGGARSSKWTVDERVEIVNLLMSVGCRLVLWFLIVRENSSSFFRAGRRDVGVLHQYDIASYVVICRFS